MTRTQKILVFGLVAITTIEVYAGQNSFFNQDGLPESSTKQPLTGNLEDMLDQNMLDQKRQLEEDKARLLDQLESLSPESSAYKHTQEQISETNEEYLELTNAIGAQQSPVATTTSTQPPVPVSSPSSPAPSPSLPPIVERETNRVIKQLQGAVEDVKEISPPIADSLQQQLDRLKERAPIEIDRALNQAEDLQQQLDRLKERAPIEIDRVLNQLNKFMKK